MSQEEKQDQTNSSKGLKELFAREPSTSDEEEKQREKLLRYLIDKAQDKSKIDETTFEIMNNLENERDCAHCEGLPPGKKVLWNILLGSDAAPRTIESMCQDTANKGVLKERSFYKTVLKVIDFIRLSIHDDIIDMIVDYTIDSNNYYFPRLGKSWYISNLLKLNEINNKQIVDEYTSKIGLCETTDKSKQYVIIGGPPPKCGSTMEKNKDNKNEEKEKEKEKEKEVYKQFLFQINSNELPECIKNEILHPQFHKNYLIQVFLSNVSKYDIRLAPQVDNVHLEARYVYFNDKNRYLNSRYVYNDNSIINQEYEIYQPQFGRLNAQRPKMGPILFENMTEISDDNGEDLSTIDWNGFLVNKTNYNDKYLQLFDVCEANCLNEMRRDRNKKVLKYGYHDKLFLKQCSYAQVIKIGGFAEYINEGGSQLECCFDANVFCKVCNKDIRLFNWNLLFSLHHGPWDTDRGYYLLVCNQCKIGLVVLFDREYGGG